MNKLLCIALLALLGLGKVYAQENSIKVNPLAILGGTDLVSYERVIGDNSTALISGAIGGFKLGSIKYSSYGGGLQYRYYFSEAIKGWYGAGVAGLQAGSVENEGFGSFGGFGSTESSETNFSAFNLGARAGYQWVWESGFTFDLNLGLAYSTFSYDDDTVIQGLRASGILPTGSLALGYSF